jgi:undecaprenyl phosphate N,N'-diacetylbacillosamine 1-phosphate transferase
VTILELVFHGRPVLYKTKRPGKNKKIVELYKFRSMTNERGKDGLLLPESKRLTKFGRLIRKTSIDELPQLFNILKGDMSIIGPRPLLIEYLPLYSRRHSYRHAVRPGLLCPRIIHTKSKTWTWGEQFENDIWYVEHVSFCTDVRMVIAVVKEVLKASDIRSNDTRAPFTGNNLYDTRSRDELGEAGITHFASLEGNSK